MWFIKEYTMKEKILLMCGICAILACSLWNLNELKTYYVWGDEFGYWSIGAYFNGLNWGNITSKIPYYSYGYGVVLGILMAIFEIPEVVYKCAVILNTLMLISCFFMAIIFAHKVFDKLPNTVAIIAAFLVICYPSNLIYVRMTWPEILLYFLFWCLTVLLLNLIEQPKISTLSVLTLICIFMYMTHERTLGIALSVIIVLFSLSYKEKMPWKYFFTFLLAVGVFFAIHLAIKENLMSNLWDASSIHTANNYSGQVEKILALFTVDGIINLLISLSGKLNYIAVSTLMFIVWGLTYVFKECFSGLRNKKLSENKVLYLFSFLILTFVFNIMISSIFLLFPSRVDHIVYGRYTENIIGPLFIIGILSVLNKAIDKETFLKGTVGLMAIACIVQTAMNLNQLEPVVMVTSVALNKFLIATQFKETVVIFLCVGTLLVLSLIICICNSKWKQTIKLLGIFLLCIMLWIPNIQVMRDTLSIRYKGESDNKIIAQYMEKYNKDGEMIYVCCDQPNYFRLAYLQYYMPTREISILPEDIKKEISSNLIIVAGTETDVLRYLKEYQLVESIHENHLLVSKDSSIAKRIEKDSILKSNDGKRIYNLHSKMLAQNVTADESKWISSGKAGHIAYGPYITLEKGSYSFNMELKNHKELSGEAVLDIYIAGNVIEKRNIPLDEATDFYIESMNLSLDDTTERIEMRLWVPEGAIVEVKEVTVGLAE